MTEENHIAKTKRAVREYLGNNRIDQAYKYFLDLHQNFTQDDPHKMDISSLMEAMRRYSSLKTLEKPNDKQFEERDALAKKITASIEALLKLIPNKDATDTIENVVEAKAIYKKYRSTGFELYLPALTLKHRQITVVVGENATGKSTLLRMLAGDLAIGKGKLRYPQFHNGKFTLNYWGTIKRQIAYIPQELPKWSGNLKDHLHYEAAIHDSTGRINDVRVNYIIDRLGLTTHINKNWKQLSGGFKLRFSLAKALVWRPQLLIIDEPLAHLDVNTQLRVLEDLRAFADNRHPYPLSIILSTQHLHETEAIANQWLFIKDGQVEVMNKLNENNSYNWFELNCNLTEHELSTLLNNIAITTLTRNKLAYLIKTPKSTQKQQLLKALLSHATAEIYYFRDTTNSIKTKFYNEAKAN